MQATSTLCLLRFLLQPSETISVGPSAEGLRVRCEVGTAWVTADGSTQDLILRPGEEGLIPARRHVVVQAVNGQAAVSVRREAA